MKTKMFHNLAEEQQKMKLEMLQRDIKRLRTIGRFKRTKNNTIVLSTLESYKAARLHNLHSLSLCCIEAMNKVEDPFVKEALFIIATILRKNHFNQECSRQD